MANKVIEMHIVRSIIQQSARNYSERQIARQLNISRNTVRHYIQRFKATTYTWEQLLELEDAALCELVYAPEDAPVKDKRRQAFEEQARYFLAELKRTGVTRHLLWQEYRQQHTDGYGYSQFCDLLTRYSSITDTSMHFEHPPGQMMMIDFAGDKL